MSFHTLVYNAPAAGVNAVNTDLAAAVDTEFSTRSSHYIFTESYRLLALAMVGASVTRGRIQVPTLNAIGEFTLFNANRSLQPPSNAQWDYYASVPIPIPQNEELQIQVSNNLGAATEIENAVLQIAPDDWTQNVERGRLVICQRISFTVTPTLNAWSGGQNLTFSQALRGGVYAVVGCVLQGSNAVAFRFIFPRNKLYHGRRLRPGGLTQNAIGDVVTNQLDPWTFGWGTWGYFHTFEPPTIEVFGTAAAGTTYQGFVWLVYLGEELALLNRYVG